MTKHWTGRGQVLGTPAFAPPEQGAGRDQYAGGPAETFTALGAILYTILTRAASLAGAKRAMAACSD